MKRWEGAGSACDLHDVQQPSPSPRICTHTVPCKQHKDLLHTDTLHFSMCHAPFCCVLLLANASSKPSHEFSAATCHCACAMQTTGQTTTAQLPLAYCAATCAAFNSMQVSAFRAHGFSIPCHSCCSSMPQATSQPPPLTNHAHGNPHVPRTSVPDPSMANDTGLPSRSSNPQKRSLHQPHQEPHIVDPHLPRVRRSRPASLCRARKCDIRQLTLAILQHCIRMSLIDEQCPTSDDTAQTERHHLTATESSIDVC